MKIFLSISLLILPLYADCQKNIPLIISNGDVIFEAIATLDSMKAVDIHERTLNWLGSKLKNAQYIVACDTPERIVRKFQFIYELELTNIIYDHEITFEIKDEKVRVRILVLGLGTGIVKNKDEWRTSLQHQRQIIENSLNELYQTYLLELQSNRSDW